MLYSVDRIEGDVAVLVDEDGNSRDVPRAALPSGIRAGDMLREQNGMFVLDADAANARRARVLQLQNSLRRRRR